MTERRNQQPGARGGGAADGRLVGFGALAVLVSVAVLGRLLWEVDVLAAIGVPTHDLIFVDARNITSAAECRALGHNPLVDNPCDPLGRPLNYPRLWLLLGFLGVDQTWTVGLGLVFGAGFLMAVYGLVGRLSLRQGLVLGAALCSPAVLFALERGQNDLVVFALVAGAAVLWRRNGIGPAAAPLAVTAAALLKLFPAAALGAGVLGRSRRAALLSVVGGLVVVAYLVATAGDLRAIGAALPQGQDWAYGARILVSSLARPVNADAWEALGLARQLVASAPLGAFAVAGWIAASRRQGVPTGPVDWRRHALHLGALVYVGTFASGNSWDYRLVFLLLALPQLFAWFATDDPRARRLAGIAIALVLVQLWLGALLAERTVADEVLSWTVAGAGSALLAADARAAWTWWRAQRALGAASGVRSR